MSLSRTSFTRARHFYARKKGKLDQGWRKLKGGRGKGDRKAKKKKDRKLVIEQQTRQTADARKYS